MKKLIMMVTAALSFAVLTGCESKEVKEYRAVLEEIVEVNKKAGVEIPEKEIDKAIETFKSADAEQQKEMLEGAKHKLMRNKAGKELKR